MLDDDLFTLAKASKVKPSQEDISTFTYQAMRDLQQGGALSRVYGSYQEREPQIRMAQEVSHALLKRYHVVIEAGTGTGKTISYLLSIVHTGQRVVVSTSTIALQKQILEAAQFLSAQVHPIDVALLMGKDNYLCLDRMYKERDTGMQVHIKEPSFIALTKKVEEDEGFDGDLAKVNLSPEVRAKVNVDSNECARHHCPLFKQCYYYQAKERAATAQVLIVSHSLLLTDAQHDGHILPAHEAVVIDEADKLREVAKSQFATEIKATKISSLLALKKLKSAVTNDTLYSVNKQFEKVWRILELRLRIPGNLYEGIILPTVNLVEPMEEGLLLAKMIREMIVSELQTNKPLDLSDKETVEYDALVKRASNVAKEVHSVFSVRETNYVYYLKCTVDRKLRKHVEVAKVPIDVAPILKEKLFDVNLTICTSATIKVEDASFFLTEVGLAPDTRAVFLPPVFDYANRAMLYLPKDLPKPVYDNPAQQARYYQDIAQRMLHLVIASRGRAFLLFTSKSALKAVHSLIASSIPYPVFMQGEKSSSKLIKEFAASGNGVLFAVKTFWTGVDIPGDALSLVVIDKIPYPVVTDPVYAARLEQITLRGGNASKSYTIPLVTLELKQGVGRLLRTDTDSGVMAILDTRISERIVNALPPAKRTVHLRDIEGFFNQEREVS